MTNPNAQPGSRPSSPSGPRQSSASSTAGISPAPRQGHDWGRAIWLAVVLVAIGLVGWTQWIAPNLEPKRFGVVVPGEIYRSGEPTPGGLKSVVDRYGIKTVIDLGAHEPGSPEERLAQHTADALGVRRIRLDLEGDATGNPEHYATTLRMLQDPQTHPVLVHCAAGSQRTGCAIAMYRQIEQGWTFDEAYTESFRFDHDPNDPNTYVRQMLEDWTWPVEVALRTGDEVRSGQAE